MRRIAVTIMTLLPVPGLGLSAAEPPEATATATSDDEAVVASSEEISTWIGELDSDRFVVRENATGRLIEAGAVSIDPLVRAVTRNNLEVTTRTIHILRELALSNEADTEESAREALRTLAGRRGTSLSRRATETLNTLDEIRRQRAVDHLQSLGARFTVQQLMLGFQNSPRLYSVEIGSEWRGDVEDLRSLRWLTDVEELTMTGQRVTDAWLEPVKGLKNLANIEINRASISNAGIAHLRDLPNLRNLSLKYVSINDGAIEHLRALKGASRLMLYGTNLTEQGAERLRAALPETAEVDRREGAFLGVGCEQLADGCVISIIHNGSAASKAGLAEGDLIVKYDGRQVDDFQGLTALIARNKGGDEVEIEVKRGDRTLTRKVTLGEWD